jgi:hypothetical protein
MMRKYHFHNQETLAQTAQELGIKALKLGLIPSLTIRLFPDITQFCIPSVKSFEPLTPEQAYLEFKKLIEASENKKLSA